MNWKIFDEFCRKNEDLTTARTEDAMMKECTMFNAQCSWDCQRTGAGPRAPLGLPGLLGQLGRWAAVAAVAAGAWLGGAREAKAWGNWGDTVYWKNNGTGTNWAGDPNNGSPVWYNSRGWDDYLNESTGGRLIIIDNDKELNQGNNLSVAGSTNRWQIQFTGSISTHTIRGTVRNTFYDNGGTMPKIENYSTVEQRYWAPFHIGNASGMEINPVNGDLSVTNVGAMGHALNVYGDNGKTLYIHQLSPNTIGSGAANMTLYVDGNSRVDIKQWLVASSKLLTVNTKDSQGCVLVRQLYHNGGNGSLTKTGAGDLTIGGVGQSGARVGYIAANAGTLTFSNVTAIATRIVATNFTLTNNATVIMKSPAQVRRFVLETGSTVEMDVFSNNSAAKLGVRETLTIKPDNESGVVSYNGRTTTLKLRLTSGFDPTTDGSFIVYEGRADANSMSGESAGITLQTVDLVGGRTLGTFALREGKNSASGAGAKTAIWVDYTAPTPAPTVSTPTASVTGTQTATLGATVEANHGKSITDYGIVYSKTVAEPEVGASGCTKAQKGTTTPTSGAAWTVNVTGLTPGTTYYYRGYATSSAGTGYSSVGTFTTLRTQTVTVADKTFTYGDSASALSVTVTGGSGTRTYSSSDDSVATVDSSGNVTPHAVGTATITVNVASDGTYEAKSGTCTVTVNRANQTVTLKKGTATSGSVDVAASVELTAATTAGSGSFTFSASPAASVTLTPGTGANANKVTVTGVRAGTVTITASAAQTATHNAASGTFTLTVNAIKPVLSTPTATVTGTTTATLGATVSSDGGQAPSAWAWGGIQWKPSTAGWTAATVASNTWSSAPSEGGAYTVSATGLTPGTHYDYRGMGKNSKGWNTASDATGSFYTKCSTPGAAGALTITQISDAQLNLNWSAASASDGGTTYYVVFRRTTSATAPTVTDGTAYSVGQTLSGWTVAGTDITQTSLPFHDTGVSQATRYYYAVYAYRKNTVDSTIAYAASASTGNELTWSTAPSSVGTLSATGLGSSRAKLTWTKGSESGVLVVVVTSGTPEPVVGTTYTGTGMYGELGGGSALGTGYVVYRGAEAKTDYTVTGLSPSTSYTAYLFPYNVGSEAATVNYGPSRSASFSTGVPSGPSVTAAGVDANGMAMAWSSVSGASSYDVEASGIGTANVPFSTDFTGWTSGKRSATQASSGGTWTLNNINVEPGNKRIYFYYTDGTDAWIELPPLNGVVTNITATLVPASTNTTGRGIWLEFYEGSEWVKKAYFTMTWTKLNQVKFVYAQPFIAKNQRVRLRNASNAWTMYVYGISVEGDNPGEGLKGRTLPVVGLSSGNSVTLSACAAGTGDYGSATVMAGVVPGEVETEKTWNSLTFSWDAPSVGTCVGYEVETSTADAGWADDVVCEGSALSSSSYSSSGWKYNGVTASGSSGTVKSAPTYSNGHCLVGKAGIGMESTDYDIAGATELELKYRVCAWNLSGASPSTDDAKTDVGRIEAYYKIDSGDWHFLGSARPSFTNDNYYTDVTNRLTEGMLNGRTVAFKLIAPNAAGDGGTYLRGAYIQALRIHKVSALAGDYTTPAETDTLEVGTETFTVSDLTAGTKRHFRVRALQGADIDHITARSVWKEATETTSAFPGPTPSVEGTGRYEVTASWPAYDGEDAGDYNISYNVQLTGCSAGGDPEEVSACPASGRDYGSSTTDWTYQRAYSGSTKSSYPVWGSPWHKLWGQFATTTTYPGLESPEMNLSGYVKGYVEFSHNYINQKTNSEVALYYKVGDGSWTKWSETPRAQYSAAANATKRNVELPPEVIGQSRVKVKLVAFKAVNYDSDPDPAVTNYVVQGASIFGARVMAQGAGGGDYTCTYTSQVVNVTATNYTFETLALPTGSHALYAGSNYYVHVQYVLTPKAGGAATTSAWGEDGNGTTAAPQLPPAEVWAEDAKQQHLTVAWNEAEGADENTRYWVQVASSTCTPEAWSSVAVQPSSTNTDLGDDDDWSYIGGGTEVDAVAGVKASETSYITNRDVYPAWAKASENSIVLAGEGAPGIESVAFSTVGATNATLSFGHGRWFATDNNAATSTVLSLYYSLDNGESWNAWANTTTTAVSYAYNNVTNFSLPSAALGKSSVKVRIVAEDGSIGKASSGSADLHARGAAVTAAKVTLKGARGNYDSCLMRDVPNLTYDQLSQVFADLTNSTLYYFRVAASDGTQYGEWTDGAAWTLAPPPTPTNAPWATAIGRHTMTIQWVPVDRAETYTLEVYTNAACSVLQERFTEIAGTEQKVTGLKAETTYWFKVRAHSDGTDSPGWSPVGSAKTVNTVAVTGLRAEEILDTSMVLKWDYVDGTTYTLRWGPTVTNGATTSRAETIECPAKSLERSDAGNGWFYLGGNGDYPAYWTSSGNPTNDQGHALIYATGGKPAMQSRWFSTLGATNATVEFLHGRFNAGADSTVLVQYSVDGGASWSQAGTADSTSATNPSVARVILLPDAALGRRSVAVRLTASGATGNKGAHLKDVKVVVRSGSTGEGTSVTSGLTTGSWTVPGPLTPGTRYWFEMTASEAGDTATAETTAATRTKTTGAVKSQGFEGTGMPYGALDTYAWGFTTNFYTVGSTSSKTWASGDPVVEVVSDENPLYGDRAIRMSGSASAGVYGVVEFDNFVAGDGSALSVTVPFASRNLASGENLWFSYSTDNGITWKAPVAKTIRTNGWQMAKIASGGSDVINQNWPYNHGSNTTTRPQGDAYVFETNGISQLKIRIAFCGNARSADHYYYLDGVTLKRLPGTPTNAKAEAQDDGSMKLTWTPPAEQSVVILRGRDERHVPQSPIDLDNLPSGYELVTMEGGSPYFPNGTTVFYDREVTSGWKYYYYFYGAMSNGDGTYSLSTQCATANDVVKGMVTAIASQGWDGWDVHPWGYRKGRVTNPGASSDGGWWKTNGNIYNAKTGYTNVLFYESWETDARNSVNLTGQYYASYYGTGAGASDADRTNQLGITSLTNYYGDHCFRLSGGGSYNWTAGGLSINTNNAAIEFDNVDLSGYKNVQFSMHIAGDNLGLGGDDLHVAISTNGGVTWEGVSSTNPAKWAVMPTQLHYGWEVIDGNYANDGHWNFYYESFEPVEYTYNGKPATSIATPEGNPYVLYVPDSVTQFMARVMFYDSNGGSKRKLSYYIDEVRLVGDEALKTPHPTMENITSNSFTVAWDEIPGASTYDVRVTQCAATGTNAVKLTESFVLNVVTNGWSTNASGSATMNNTTARRGSSGYGLLMGGNGTELTSPEVGAARQVTFWSKAVSDNANSKLLVQVSEDGTTWQTLTNYTAATASSATAIGSDAWVQKTVDLPHRQWSRIRFRMERTSGSKGNFYLDDIDILGGGAYADSACVVATASGLSGTRQGFTNGVGGVTINPGTPYFVEVKAHGTLAGNPTHSSWGETGDYTAGTINLAPDGFEMVRMWGTASSAADVLIASSAGDDPIGTPSAGTTYSAGDALPGGGTVVSRWTSSKTENSPFEHVVPAGAQVNYAVFWKRGSYYEGRYDTNFWMGQYGCDAAEAFAQTNDTNIGSAWVANGHGFSGNWTVASNNITWTCAKAKRNSAQPFGLLKNTQLYGAGGNMLALYPGESKGDRTVSVTRQLSTTFGKNEMWWGMFTMSISNSAGSSKWAGIQLLNASGQNKASIGKLWSGNTLGIEGSATANSSYAIGNNQTNIVVFLWDNANQKMLVAAKKVNSATDPVITASTPAPGQTGGWAWQTEIALSMDDITQVRFAAQNSASDCLGNVYFDEFRIGPTWDSLIKEPAPPNPVTSAHAIPDGKELVRLDWTYGSSDADHPAATGVLVLDKATAWTDAEIASIKPVNGQRYTAGQSIGAATVAYLGPAGWTNGTTLYQDAVVEPGSVHYYRFFAHSGYIYTNGVAASSTAPSGYPVTMGTYLENEFVDTFSYTNGTLAGTTWKGGKGFENGESDKHYWGSVTNTWTAVLPESQPGHESGMPTFAAIEGYPASAGNLVKFSNPGNGGSGSMTRDLTREITAADTNFYVAFRMAYQYEGANKWAGLSLLDSSGTEKGFAGKGHGSYWYTLCVEGNSGNKSWGNDFRGYDGAVGNTYLVIMRYSFANNSLSAMTVGPGAQVPNYEPTVWAASMGVSISGIKKLRFTAGCTDSGATIGDVWFDELRWGTSWEDILSGVCPESIEGAWWQHPEGIDLRTNYLGNSGTFLIRSTPIGFGQEAWLTIDWTGGASGHTVTTNQLAFLKNDEATPACTWWSNQVQAVEVGKVGGPSASANWRATAKVTAMNADCEVTSETTLLTVKPLGKPTNLLAVRDPVKTNSVINVSWKPWKGTLTGVDTAKKDVLVVRFTGSSEEDAKAKAAVAANQPVQGRTYMAGDSIGEGTVVWLGGDAGAVTNTPAKGLMPNTWYAFALYTENYSYYSPYNAAAVVATNTAEGGHEITIDGDPTDWYGEAPDTLNTAWVSLGEFIWKDKTGEARQSKSGDSMVENPSSDIEEFRVYADRDWVYFLVKMTNITDSTLPYVVVGLDDRRTGSSTKIDWLGDDGATFLGSNYWWTSANAHYPRWQLNVHQVTGEGTQVEMYTTDSTEWYAPQGMVDDQIWSAAVGTGVGQAVEFRVPRSDIGLSGLEDGATKVQRFTVATFKNRGVWNNKWQDPSTAEIYPDTSKAVDSLAIAPQLPKSVPDNDYLLNSMKEDISDGQLDFWVDVTFNANGIVENARPGQPTELVYPEQNASLKHSPTFQWKGASDTDGRVTGFMLEVSTNANFNDLNGTVELRVNVAATNSAADMPSAVYSYDWNEARQQTLYYWRVRSRDTGGRLSTATNGVFWVEEDGDGPVATLKYVGTDVDGYLNGDYAQLEELSPESLLSVLDEDVERVKTDPSLRFGFVLEWRDPNGVYATNQIRGGASGSRVDDYKDFHGTYSPGDWAWNIGSTDGRVSPNWDLVEFHKDLTNRLANTNTFPEVTDSTGRGAWTTNYWDEMGCWGYQWGYDDAFMVGTAGTAQDQTRGANGDEVITNLVRSAFDMHAFDTNVDYYLTVSAEDCTTWKESGSGWWDDASWKSFKNPTDSDAPGKDYSSGWCKDGPNRARNVTTNQLLQIHVRDNDITPPVRSTAKWYGATGEGGRLLEPAMAVTSGGAMEAPSGWDPTWADLGEQGRVPTPEGEGSSLAWQLTDADVSTYTHPATASGSGSQAWRGSAKPIRLFFNLYDEYVNTGLASFKTYAAGTPWNTSTWTAQDGMEGTYTSLAGTPRTLRNTGLLLAGENNTITTNWASYVPGWSKVTQHTWSGGGNNKNGMGTGPDSVLAWQFDATEANLKTLLGHSDLLSNASIGINPAGDQLVVTNSVKLFALDSDNNGPDDQEGAELEFGQLLFTDDDATPPEMAGFTSQGTGTNFTWFGRLGQWSFGNNSNAPVFTATPLMPAITLSSEVNLHQYNTRTDPTRHWNSSSHTIYYDGAGGRATDWNQTGAPYFEFTLAGNGNTVWNADMVGFENRTAQAGPTLYALTVQAPTLAFVNNAVHEGAINTDDGWVGANVTSIETYSGKEAIKLLTTTGSVTFGPQACAQLTGLTVECQVAAFGSLASTASRKLKIQYKATGDSDWSDLPGGSYTVSSFSNYGEYQAFSYDLVNIPGLLGSGKEVEIRVIGTDLGSGTGQGYAVAGLAVTAARGDAVETLLGRIAIDKEMDAAGANFAAETVTSVIFGFDRPIRCALDDRHIFRLYAFDATRYNSDGELEHLSAMPSDGGWTYTWGIKNLFLHGTATEPKHTEVTDHDVARGAWTNNLEVLDGPMAGYDTVRSGLRVYDRTTVTGSTTNRVEYSGETPTFRIVYPSAYTNNAPNGDPDGIVTGGELLIRSVSEATFNHLSDPGFAVGAPTWTLSASGAAVSGGKLTLADGASAWAKQTVSLDAMSDVKSATVSGTVRAKGTLASDAGGENKLTVTAKVYSRASALMTTLTTNLTLTSRAKNYAVGPWPLAYNNVGSVEFTVGQTDATATELVVESLSGYVAQWGDDITEADDAWATTVTNGMEAAKVTVRTPDLDLTTTSVPLSVEGSGHSQPANQWYKLEATVHDYDSDREGDALSASASTNFWLYDDDVMPPQWGEKFDSPMGIFVNGTIISLKARRESGVNQIWPILDSDLTGLAPDSEVLFSLSAYDYSGWKATSFALGSETVQSGDSVASAAATAGWSQVATNGAAESPSATNTWSIGAKNLYTAHRTDFTANAGAGVTAEMTANATDLDNDRLNDSLPTGSSLVGKVWFADQDVSAPGWGAQTTPYEMLMVSMGLGSGDELADLLGTEEAPAPFALGGAANNQGPFAGRSYTVYDGELAATGAANQFVVTANLNDPLPTGDGARARHPTGLQRGSTLTETRAMWGDDPTSPSDTNNVFTITNTYIVLETTAKSGRGSMTNVAFSSALTDPAIGKTRINTQAGHTSWAWTFSTDDVGRLLEIGETSETLALKVHAFDADANRHEDQMHAELVGPTITLRDDDTTNPNPPTELKVNGADVPSSVTRENAAWTNDLSGWALSFVPANDDATPNAGDLAASGVDQVNGYRMVKKDTGTACEGAAWLNLTNVVDLTTTADGARRRVGLTASQRTNVVQGLTTQLVFAVDMDADRPGDALGSRGVDVPLAYDITPPPVIGTENSKRLVADPESTDDPTTQFDLTWPTKVGDGTVQLGPDDTGHTNHPAKGDKTKYDYLSPWATYKVYYTNYEESAIASDDDPISDTKSWVYTNFIKTAKYLNWTSVTASATAADPTAPTREGRSVAYESLGTVTNNMTNDWQKVRLYDLDFDQHYIVVIVGVDKAGNEGPAGMWSWATNNTIKFALTQGVVRATATIDSTLEAMSAEALTHAEIKRPDMSETAPKRGAVLYWMASENKTTHLVNKEYDLIYRDAPFFTENGTERDWTIATSVITNVTENGTAIVTNTGTSKANWNYQVDDFSGLGNGKLRFYRASYKDRWNPPEGKLPLASEDVYAMSAVRLTEGMNFVSLHGYPWTNSLRGVFGTDTNIWPAGSRLEYSTRVGLFDGVASEGAQAFAPSTNYWLGSDGKWHVGNDNSTDVSDNPLDERFFTRGFSIELPALGNKAEYTNSIVGLTNVVVTNVVDNEEIKETKTVFTNRDVGVMTWYPILRVPTNGPAAMAAEGGTPGTAGRTARTASADEEFSTVITTGGHRGGEVYNFVSFCLPVSVHPKQLKLEQTNEQGDWIGGFARSTQSGGLGLNDCDVLYPYDSETKEVRQGMGMFVDKDGKWRYLTRSNYPEVTGTPLQANDALVILSRSKDRTKVASWTWTYRPSDFYAPPTRHMGRERLGE